MRRIPTDALRPGEPIPTHPAPKDVGLDFWGWLREAVTYKPLTARQKRVAVWLAVSLALPIFLAANVLTAKATDGRLGAVIAQGDSLYESAPWGSLALTVPIRVGDGDLVVASTDNGTVIKRYNDGTLISENPNGLTFRPGEYKLRSKVWMVLYCPLIKPRESGPAQIAQGAAFERAKWEGAAQPRSDGGRFKADFTPNGPQGQLWLRDVRFAFQKANVTLAGRKYTATVCFEPPMVAGSGSGVTIMRLDREPQGLKPGTVNIEVSPA